MDSFLRCISVPDFIFLQRPRTSDVGGGVGFFIRKKIESPFYWSFGNMVVSSRFHGCSLLLACIYCSPGSYTCNFQEIFMSFFSFLSSINSLYFTCGDFNIHVDVSVGGRYKFMNFLDSCDLKQSVSLHGHILDLILSPSDHDTIVDVEIPSCISQMFNCFLIKWLILQIKCNIGGTTASTCLT